MPTTDDRKILVVEDFQTCNLNDFMRAKIVVEYKRAAVIKNAYGPLTQAGVDGAVGEHAFAKALDDYERVANYELHRAQLAATDKP